MAELEVALRELLEVSFPAVGTDPDTEEYLRRKHDEAVNRAKALLWIEPPRAPNAHFTGFKRGIEAAIEYHEMCADEIRDQPQLEAGAYDAIAFHEEAIQGLSALVPGRRNTEQRLRDAETLLRKLSSDIGFAEPDALVKHIDEFLRRESPLASSRE